MSRFCLVNAELVLPAEVVPRGALLVEDGIIAAVEPAHIGKAECFDLEGKTLLPGMIDLHCDALEKEVEPRPGVHFPLDFACAQADKRNAAAGITSVFHALSFANEEFGVRNNEIAARVARAVHGWQPHALVNNLVHCRYEVTDVKALPSLLKLMDEGAAHLVSLMDHTPGQGQFKDEAAYRSYLSRAYRKSDQAIDALLQQKLDDAQGAAGRVRELVGKAHALSMPVASHDDDSPDRIAAMRQLGVTLSEFPVNAETARAAKEAGIATIFGAPNVLRGESQSGSMRAIDAIQEGVADCLCADYAPATLIVALYRLLEQTDLGLPEAARLVSRNPARAAGLPDRGEISVGKRADLIAVSHLGGLPQVSGAWVGGSPVFSVHFDHGRRKRRLSG